MLFRTALTPATSSRTVSFLIYKANRRPKLAHQSPFKRISSILLAPRTCLKSEHRLEGGMKRPSRQASRSLPKEDILLNAFPLAKA